MYRAYARNKLTPGALATTSSRAPELVLRPFRGSNPRLCLCKTPVRSAKFLHAYGSTEALPICSLLGTAYRAEKRGRQPLPSRSHSRAAVSRDVCRMIATDVENIIGKVHDPLASVPEYMLLEEVSDSGAYSLHEDAQKL